MLLDIFEAQKLFPLKTNIKTEHEILGLEKNLFEKLELEVIEYVTDAQTLEDDFIVYLCDKYNLDEKK